MLQFTRLLAWLALIVGVSCAEAPYAAAQNTSSRGALVIGNGTYSEAPIEGAVEGARAIAEALRLGGFRVVYLENARRDEIERGLAAFAQGLAPEAVGVIYYAGHAVQYQGRNYLVATNSKINGADDLWTEAVDLGLFLDPLIVAHTPASVIVLDASRQNPWQGRVAANLRGIANPESTKTVTVISSAAPGKTVDGGQADTVFSQQLVQAMRTPGIGFDDVISRVRAAVSRADKDHVIWTSANPPGDLVITPAASANAKPADAVELGFWETIKNSTNAADYQAYLSAYPQGQFAEIARSKLGQLQQKTAAAGQGPAPATPAPAAEPATAPASGPIRDCSFCPELVLIPAGSLTMGATDGFAFETPVHEVTIPKPFYIGRREVTFDEWDACLSDGGCQYRPGDRGQGRGLKPAADLDWNDTKAYLAWISRKTGKTYRLATKSEWEYAARAGTKTTYYWGTAVEKDHANCAGCNTNPINKTTATGTFPPNAFGLFDMAGNAAEWVEDCWADNYKNAPKDGSAYDKADCRERVLRGGSFNNDPRFVRTAARFKYDFDVRYYTNGFRVVREQ